MTDVIIAETISEHYKFFTKVAYLGEEYHTAYVSGVGADAVFREQKRGWFIRFAGSQERMFIGADRPALAVGDEVEVIIRKRR